MTDWELIARAIKEKLLLIQELDDGEYGDVKCEPIYFHNGTWRYGATGNHMTPDFVRETYVEYKKPKMKVKLWQWAEYDDDKGEWAFSCDGAFRASGYHAFCVKVEGSMIEVEE